MEQAQLINIEKKLDLILKLMASALVDGKSLNDKVLFLSGLGFSDNIIAEIAGVKPVTIRSTKSTLKRKRK